MKSRLKFIGSVALSAFFLFGGCTPGYIKPDRLEELEQGPSHCASRCHELGMRMGALVLVSDQLPGCVCVPAGAAAQSQGSAERGASVATVGHVVIAAAAAAQEQQRQRQQQQRQQQQRQQQR